MNDITDITILIAVIALALWPIILFLTRAMNERRKRMEHLDRMTKDELDGISTRQVVTGILKTIGCQPEVNEEGHVIFKYQGDDFYIATEEENRFIMIWNPWWGSIDTNNKALPVLKEIINLVNVNSLITTVYMDDEDGKTIGLHSRCHTYFTPNEGEPEEHLRMLLDLFFDTHNAIKENLNQLGNATVAEEEKKERVKVKGFSAYKENTIPIEPENTQSDKQHT